MTEETLKCPFCEEELYSFSTATLFSCENSKCIIFDKQITLTQFDRYDMVICKLKQKSYSEGYEKGKEESIGYMHKNVCQICKQNRQDEGRMAVCMPCYEKELEK